jgi:hypothetical protein
MRRLLILAASLVLSIAAAGGSGADGSITAASAGESGAGVGESAAAGGQRVRFTASFSPERLGAGTTIGIGFQVIAPAGTLPLPLTGMSMLLPRGLSIAAAELGLQTCLAAKLEREGPAGCPPNSPLGHGSATAAVPFGSQLVAEHVAIMLFSAPLQDGHPTLLVYVNGEHPVIAGLAFPAAILSGSGAFGALIDTTMPPVPGLPGGPDVAVVRFATTIGPQGIVYRERVHGRLVKFRPQGIMLPTRCPRGGFPFGLRLTFLDGTQASVRTAVPCPRRRDR